MNWAIRIVISKYTHKTKTHQDGKQNASLSLTQYTKFCLCWKSEIPRNGHLFEYEENFRRMQICKCIYACTYRTHTHSLIAYQSTRSYAYAVRFHVDSCVNGFDFFSFIFLFLCISLSRESLLYVLFPSSSFYCWLGMAFLYALGSQLDRVDGQ